MIKVPSLVKRLDDIPILTKYFVESICKEQGLEKKEFSKRALSKLEKYPWTGNVGELRNVVERLMILGENPITAKNIEQFASK